MASSTGEKVIVVIGTGLAIATVASCLSWLVVAQIFESGGGWFAYAPDTGPTFDTDLGSDRFWAAVCTAGIWLAAIGLWLAVSLHVWRGPDEPGEGEPKPFLTRMRQRD